MANGQGEAAWGTSGQGGLWIVMKEAVQVKSV
jgi:hypothetical protein